MARTTTNPIPLSGALRGFTLAIGAAAAAIGCARESPSHDARGAPIVYVGSSTIGDHILPEAARAFTARTGVPVHVAAIEGSGVGLDAILDDRAEIAGVARPLTLDEKQLLLDSTIIGYDTVGVFVHPSNPVDHLTVQQLRDVFTGDVDNWSAVGGPDAPIVCITQAWTAKRAQMVEFQLRVMQGAPYRDDRKECDRQDDQVRDLAREPNGISVLSTAYADASIKSIPLHGASQQGQESRPGRYPFSRALLLVTPVDCRPVVREFVDFMLSPEGQAIVARKFVPIRPGRLHGSN